MPATDAMPLKIKNNHAREVRELRDFLTWKTGRRVTFSQAIAVAVRQFNRDDLAGVEIPE
jgi:hypothetical protein